MSACREHGRLCAYTGEEPDRCPWCHARWEVIVRTRYHSCEVYQLWHHDQDPPKRVVTARRWRSRATQRLGLDQ